MFNHCHLTFVFEFLCFTVYFRWLCGVAIDFGVLPCPPDIIYCNWNTCKIMLYTPYSYFIMTHTSIYLIYQTIKLKSMQVKRCHSTHPCPTVKTTNYSFSRPIFASAPTIRTILGMIHDAHPSRFVVSCRDSVRIAFTHNFSVTSLVFGAVICITLTS